MRRGPIKVNGERQDYRNSDPKYGPMPLLRSLTVNPARLAINMALLTELFARFRAFEARGFCLSSGQ